MQYGICNLSIISLRLESSDKSELVSQILFGEHFKVLEKQTKWSKIRLEFDKYEGWVDNKQYIEISEEEYINLSNSETFLAGELIVFISDSNKNLTHIPLGSSLPSYINSSNN